MTIKTLTAGRDQVTNQSVITSCLPHRTLCLLTTAILLITGMTSAASAGGTTASVKSSVANGIVYLTSVSGGHTARIGLNTAWGGAIVEVSLDGVNYVNAHDSGREVQPALYDGAAPYTEFNCSPCIGTWGWDPVLGGDKYNHGSPVTAITYGVNSVSVTTTALEWNPDDKGGGATKPVPSNVTMTQTASVVAGSPLAFQVQVTMTHNGSEQRYLSNQEFPAVYVNSKYSRFSYYSGSKPWTNSAVTTLSAVPVSPGTGLLYSAEQWSAYTNSSNVGLTVYVPGQYPYIEAASLPGTGGSGPTGDASFYSHSFAPMTVRPKAVIQGTVYLIPGNATTARTVVNGLHSVLSNADIAAPFGNVEAPAAGAQISGTSVPISGWAIDNIAVASLNVLVDGVMIATPAVSIARPDVAAAYPHVASSNPGWVYYFDSTLVANGSHAITVQITDSSGNKSLLAPVNVLVSN